MSIGNRIKLHRERCRLTQEQLAFLLNTSPQNIYKYEKGIIKNIPLSNIEEMARIFSIPPERLTGWEYFPEEQSEPAVVDGKPLDEQDLKLLRLLRTMTPEEKDWLLSRIDALLSLR